MGNIFFPKMEKGKFFAPLEIGVSEWVRFEVYLPLGDILNNFCFHVYAQKSLFIGENCNGFFLTLSSPPDPLTLEFIELVPS